MLFEFEKWHGLGNDFVIARADEGADLWQQYASEVCDRNRGIGADGILLVNSITSRMQIINADGSFAEMCGNGLRCAAAYIQERGGETPDGVLVSVSGRTYAANVSYRGSDRFEVSADFPLASFAPALAGVDGTHSSAETHEDGTTSLSSTAGHGVVVSTANPHWVFLEHPGLNRLPELGPQLEHDPRFANRTNVEFVESIGPGRWRVRVWERGSGLTEACGTGALAVASVLVQRGEHPKGEHIIITLPGGDLTIVIGESKATIVGPAVRVFTGMLELGRAQRR